MHVERIAPAAIVFRRDRATLASYALLALLTLSYGMIGPLLPWLRDALGLSYQQASYHSVAMAVGVTVTGLLVPTVARHLGRKGCVGVGLAAMSAGLLLICIAPAFIVSLAACVIIGAALPFVVTVAPAVLKERAGPHTGIAMAEANTIAYLGFLLAPAFVSAAAATLEWRWAFAPAWAIYAAYWLVLRKLDLGVSDFGQAQAADATLPRAFWWHWIMLVFAISAELCIVVWGPSFLETVLGQTRERALWASMAFPLGMLFGRVGVSLALRFYSCEQLTLGAIFCGALGALMVLSASSLPVAVAGMVLSGLGMAGLYPFGITLAMEAAKTAADRAAARASLASGSAMLLAPLAIGFVADRAGLKVAFGLVPVFLFAAALAHLAGRGTAKN